MPAFLDMTGSRFGRLSITGYRREKRLGRSTVVWIGKCDCGGAVEALGQDLRTGKTRSCGCLRSELTSARHRTHGHSRMAGKASGTYSTWASMIQRCTNENKKEFHRYGARGITVCDRWLTFANFLADMGEKPAGMTLDRIDNDLGYGPLNCRWATMQQQSNNTTRNRKYSLNGETLTMREWARRAGVTDSTMSERLQKWPLERALTLPAARKRKRDDEGKYALHDIVLELLGERAA